MSKLKVHVVLGGEVIATLPKRNPSNPSGVTDFLFDHNLGVLKDEIDTETGDEYITVKRGRADHAITSRAARGRNRRPPPRRSNPGIDTKAERAAKMYAFIVEHATAGKTVYLQTALKTTAIKKKHLPQVRVRNGSLEIQSGKRWLDYTWVNRVSASD